ncbi:MAG: HEAT repeat domain-containing protein, partial [Chloroflexota bacterium]
GDEDRELRAMAAKLLSTFQHMDPSTHLIRALKNDRHSQVRRAAAESLGNSIIITDEIENAVIEALYDRSKLVRRAVVQSLRLLESTSAVPGLIGVMLGDADSHVRLEATKTLDALEAGEAIPAFIEALNADENSYVRYTAAGALGKYEYSDLIVKALANTLQADKNSYVRHAAATTLATLLQRTQEPDIVRLMLTGLDDANTHVWHTIAEGLWGAADVVIPVVMERLLSTNSSRRATALKAALWLSAEFDDDYAPSLDDEIDPSTYGWWN